MPLFKKFCSRRSLVSKRNKSDIGSSNDGNKSDRTLSLSLSQLFSPVDGSFCWGNSGTGLSAPSPLEKMAYDYQAAFNKHDIEALRNCFDPTGEVVFVDASMVVEGFIDELGSLFRSFPDLSMPVESVVVEEDGSVVALVSGVQGTHTGGPYGFGPYPPIPVTGTHVVLDAEKCIFTLNDEGLITKLRVQPLGEVSGPPAFYTKIGGLVF